MTLITSRHAVGGHHFFFLPSRLPSPVKPTAFKPVSSRLRNNHPGISSHERAAIAATGAGAWRAGAGAGVVWVWAWRGVGAGVACGCGEVWVLVEGSQSGVLTLFGDELAA